MSIEIRELVIKAQVHKGLSRRNDSHAITSAQLKKIKKEILEECYEKLSRKLDDKMAR